MATHYHTIIIVILDLKFAFDSVDRTTLFGFFPPENMTEKFIGLLGT